ncbi:MAG: hypothetical protein K2Y51_08965 [Gammaproteobacteria bacterium]|jgi:hypothetical protein|nr:hypothetical protein [Gammaproteobacteria bacterium]
MLLGEIETIRAEEDVLFDPEERHPEHAGLDGGRISLIQRRFHIGLRGEGDHVLAWQAEGLHERLAGLAGCHAPRTRRGRIENCDMEAGRVVEGLRGQRSAREKVQIGRPRLQHGPAPRIRHQRHSVALRSPRGVGMGVTKPGRALGRRMVSDRVHHIENRDGLYTTKSPDRGN